MARHGNSHIHSSVSSGNAWKYAKYNFRATRAGSSSNRYPPTFFLLLAGRTGFYRLYVCEAVGLPTTPESTEKKSLLRLHTGDVYKRCFGQITNLTLSNWSKRQQREIEFAH